MLHNAMRLPGLAKFGLLAVALACLSAATYWSIRIGWADHRMRQETVSATERAIALIPDDAEYRARLAWLVSDRDPQKAGDALRRAVALNPWDAKSLIELGLMAEAAGDKTTTQRYLMRAAQADRMFLPRWTLANYYYRQNDLPMFWFWAKQAAAMLYGDALPLFKLCARVEEDGTLIDRLQIRNPDVRSAYLSYLLGQKRIDLIGLPVHALLLENRAADTPLLLTACERLLEANRAGEAADVWNRLAALGRVPFRTPAGEGAQLIANNRFTETPASRGFDWRLPVVEGVSVSREEDESRGLRVTFSGREPEECEMLIQLVPVAGKTQYQLSFDYRTQGIAGGSGLQWRITDASGGAVLSDGPILASEADTEGQSSFKTTAVSRLLRLALQYHRTLGTTRIEGFLLLRNVALKPLAQPPIEGTRVRK